MKLVTTLLLFCMTLFAQAQDTPVTAVVSTTTEIAASNDVATIAGFETDDDDFEGNEKMAVSVREKRQSDEFIDTMHVTELLIAFFINLIAIAIIVRGLYYPKCKRGEFFFTYILIAISTFMLIYVLGDVKLKAGIALGLFAIFSIIRYRTEQVAI